MLYCSSVDMRWCEPMVEDLWMTLGVRSPTTGTNAEGLVIAMSTCRALFLGLLAHASDSDVIVRLLVGRA